MRRGGFQNLENFPVVINGRPKRERALLYVSSAGMSGKMAGKKSSMSLPTISIYVALNLQDREKHNTAN